MPIEVTCRKCGKILILKEAMAGKAGKCPKCGNVIRVPRALGLDEGSTPTMSAHVEGIRVRGGQKKEDVPSRGSAMTGFTRSTALVKTRTSAQAMLGLVLSVVGLVAALVPGVAPNLGAPPVLAMGGGLVGAVGAAFSGWGLMNIRQQRRRFKGMGIAIAGLAVGVLALLVGLGTFSRSNRAAGGPVTEGPEALESAGGRAARGECADKLKSAYSLLKTYADEHRGKFPKSPTKLYPEYVSNLEPFCCPVASGGTMQYQYTPGLTTESPEGAPLLYDGPDYHGEDGRNVLMVSGKVVWLTEEEFQAKQDALAGESAETPEAESAESEPAAEEPTESQRAEEAAAEGEAE